MAQDIVFNSIIDSEHNEAYKTTSFQEGTIDYKTMADRFATVTFGTNDTTGKVRIFIDAFSEITSADNEAENGWMRGKPRGYAILSTLPDLIAGQDNLLIFSHLLFTTNWKDSLQAIRDEEYEKRDLPDYDNSVTIRGRVPQHRYFGFTAFCGTRLRAV